MELDVLCCRLFGCRYRTPAPRQPASGSGACPQRIGADVEAALDKSDLLPSRAKPAPEALRQVAPPHPLDAADCLVRVTVGWLTPLIGLANRRPLREEDVWAAPKSFCPEALARTFWEAYRVEAKAAAQLGSAGRRPAGTPPVARALVRAFWPQFLCTGALLMAFAGSMLLQPFLISGLLRHLRAEASEGAHVGFALASAMLVCSALSSLLISNFSRISRAAGVRVKIAITCAVFQHAMEMSAAARLSGSIGQTTNLMGVDAEKLYLASNFLHFVWMSPLMAMAVGCLLTSLVGPSALCGLALIVLMWPAQLILAKYGGHAGKVGMGFTDERVKFVTEVVRGIRGVKLCAWEEPVFERASQTRQKETRWLSLGLFLKAITREGILVLLPPATLAVIFALEHVRGVRVDETTALTALGLLNTLRFPFNLFAASLASCQDALVACGRLSEFMQRPVRPKHGKGRGELPLIEVTRARFTWRFPHGLGPSRESAFDLLVPRLSLAGASKVAVIGRVASGKSSLLAALLGEMRRLHGTCALRGRVAYMGQAPWVQNASLRDNILFGNPFDEVEYWRAVAAAALQPDLDVLVDGDLTEIGERGINLSGGQKARVGIARCMYAAATRLANVIMLDCPFDALDAPTGQRVFQGLAELGGQALLICSMSAQVHLLPQFDTVVVVESGMVAKVADLATVAAAYPKLVQQSDSPVATKGPAGVKPVAPVRPTSPKRPKHGVSGLSRKDANKSGSISHRMMLTHLGGALGAGAEAGAVLATVVLAIFVAGQACRVGSDVAITAWASDAVPPAVAFGLLGACAALLALRIAAVVAVSSRAAVTLHRRTFWRMLQAPVVEYFDVTTSGEIINKFSKDMETADAVLPESCMQFLSNCSQLATIVALSAYAIPWFLAILVALGVLFAIIARRFSAVSRDLKRLDGSTRSPVYNIFAESLAGLETIRAWQAQERFVAEFFRRARHNLAFFHTAALAEAWVMARLESLSFGIIGAFAFSAVGMRGSVQPRLVGLALVYSIQLTAMLQRTVQLAILINQQMTSCERVLSFQSVQQEPPRVLPTDADLPDNWPSGAMAFERVVVRYRGGEPVLKGVSFAVRAGERVGVCGRTGAGKSSLIAALFRLVEPCGGRICLDGVDICSVGLRTLRSRLSVIPQEPVLFSGSIRDCLDPFGRAPADAVLEEALRSVGLSRLLEPGRGGLLAPVAENGENLSQGQRQLLCIARATVHRAKITVLDEATSSMDAETDRAVQKALARHWKAGGGTTLLTVAHRLRTILDYDRVLVLSFGEVAEFDSPAVLRARPQGSLAKMLREGGQGVR